MIRVLVKGSSVIAQAGLEQLLAADPGLFVIRAGKGDPEEREDNPPDVIIMERADADEESLLSEVLDLSAPASAFLLLVDDPASIPQSEAVRAGAKGILSRRTTRDELVAAIRAAAAGLLVFHADAFPILPPGRSPAVNRAAALVEPLTIREKEVLAILAEGGSNKDIASRLAVSEHTAKFHVSSIMSKLGATSRTEAVTLAIRLGLVMI